MVNRLDTLIVGAGVVGCAVAYALRHCGDTVFWVEAASGPGSGMTSRNSGVIHAGLYYPADSLKTKFCREGAKLLYAFATTHGVAHQQTGKYLVANGADQMEYLNDLKQKNEAVVLETVTNLPKGIRADGALFSPLTGVIDQHELVAALIQASGIQPLYHQRVETMVCEGSRVRVTIGDEVYSVGRVFNCTGLKATGFLDHRQHFFARGSYFQVKLPPSLNLPHLIYPAVPKQSPSLGIHLTRNLYGEAFLGPDLNWIDGESYAVNPDDAPHFFEAARQYLPWLELAMLQPAYSGIRAKLNRHKFSDFELFREGEKGQLCHFLGIESPGLTAALALGRHGVVEMGLAD